MGFDKASMKGWGKEVLIFGISGLIIAAYVVYRYQLSPNRNGSKLKEVQQLSSEAPIFPSFKDGGSNSNAGYGLANVTRYFYSTTDYDEVKAFYSTSLTQRGWHLAKEGAVGRTGRELTFTKEDMSIIIFYTGKDSDQGYDYAINYVWRDNR